MLNCFGLRWPQIVLPALSNISGQALRQLDRLRSLHEQDGPAGGQSRQSAWVRFIDEQDGLTEDLSSEIARLRTLNEQVALTEAEFRQLVPDSARLFEAIIITSRLTGQVHPVDLTVVIISRFPEIQSIRDLRDLFIRWQAEENDPWLQIVFDTVVTEFGTSGWPAIDIVPIAGAIVRGLQAAGWDSMGPGSDGHPDETDVD